MIVAEKGGQWLLSCYAPFKEKSAFPGFEDHSFEEIRLGYYEAVKNGTVEQYVRLYKFFKTISEGRLFSETTGANDASAGRNENKIIAVAITRYH